MRKLKIGDVFSLQTLKGYAYVQYVDAGDDGIELIRVLSGLFSERPKRLEGIVESAELFSVHFPLAAAWRKGIVEFIDHFPVPADFELPGYMRTKHVVRGEFICWHIVDVKTLKLRSVDQLSASERLLSPWGIWNDTLLRERLEKGWRLEDW